MSPETRLAERVAAVVAAEVRRLGLEGVALASPPGPGSDLLARWLSPVGRVGTPDPGAVSDVAGALAAAGAPGAAVEGLAWRAVADALAAAERLLPVAATDKTGLLLDPAPLPARVVPLGDVWATTVRALAGRATLPPVLAHARPQDVERVEAALRAYLEEGLGPDAAFAALGPLGGPVRRALDAAEGRRRGLLVPKLEAWTVGADLAR
ncbi:MAG: hypothetical protein AMXMBFR53_43950 [Gemmatimonadota bacterium]